MVHRARLAVVGVAVAGTFACGSPDTPDGLTDTGIRLDPIVEIGDRDGEAYIGRPHPARALRTPAAPSSSE
jgi:hypothetical protein